MFRRFPRIGRINNKLEMQEEIVSLKYKKDDFLLKRSHAFIRRRPHSSGSGGKNTPAGWNCVGEIKKDNKLISCRHKQV